MGDSQTATVSRFTHEAMSTVFEVFVSGKKKNYAGQASRAAFDEIDRIERLFNRFDPTSEISRISRLESGESMRIGVETVECLTIAARIQTETRGAFDINFRARREALPSKRDGHPDWGGTHRENQSHIPAPLLFDLIRLERTGEGFEVTKSPAKDSKLDLDLGAIGKGYAIDKALEVLNDWGVKNTLLHAGTSTAIAVGDGPGVPGAEPGWAVGVAGGWECGRIPTEIRLRNKALSGSGTEVKGGHIVEPWTGRKAAVHLAAWASHLSGTEADALSTAFMVMRAAEIQDYSSRHPDVWALVILDAKRCKIFNEDAIT